MHASSANTIHNSIIMFAFGVHILKCYLIHIFTRMHTWICYTYRLLTLHVFPFEFISEAFISNSNKRKSRRRKKYAILALHRSGYSFLFYFSLLSFYLPYDNVTIQSCVAQLHTEQYLNIFSIRQSTHIGIGKRRRRRR